MFLRAVARRRPANARLSLGALFEEAAQIPLEQAVAPEQAENGSQRQERAEGHGILAATAARDEEHDGDRPAREDTQQDGQQDELPAEEGPHHSAQLHVAPTHPAAADQDDQKEQPPAEDDAEERVEPAGGMDGDAQRRARDDAGDGDHVRDDLMIHIDARDGDEGRQENQRRTEIESGAEAIRGQGEEDGGDELHRGIAPGDRTAAAPAAGTQAQPGEDRYVVVPADGRAAMGTGRARLDYAAPRGEPSDHDVEEAADDQPKEKAGALEEPGREQGGIVHGLCSPHCRRPTSEMPTREGWWSPSLVRAGEV